MTTPIFHAMSVAELRDLVKAYDYKMHQLVGGVTEYSPSTLEIDPGWQEDFTALGYHYALARQRAVATIDAQKYNPLPENTIAAQPEWDALVKSHRQNPPGLTKGDFQDLYQRAVKVGARFDFSAMPQPAIGSDWELDQFKKADAIVRVVEKGISVAVPVGLGLGLGVLALVVVLKR